ncbi:MAG: hypothetical protein A3G81_16765 [Betaproteobacteria bacterium RIFCSPLOWO2_12_FULL_65_14]|nr:MAG: hypothetical protein A3G81_16765 [Betaproteobacteria bacterium RIFCSPLOWO2_12_FULL_65_14]
MRVSLMQPYFFPYLGYFDLINCSDRWIVFDTAQYIKQGWVNRNRVLHTQQGWEYIIVPVKKHPHNTAIGDVEISDDRPWRQKIMRQLMHYQKQAPYYRQVVDLVGACLASQETHISKLNVRILDIICSYLGIPFRYQFLSDMGLDLGQDLGPGEWGLQVSIALGASEYVNAPGGRALFDEQAFKRAGVMLNIRNVPPMQYACGRYQFEPHLSIIDVMMWNDGPSIKRYLDIQRAAASDSNTAGQHAA